MSEILETIKNALADLFPEVGTMTLTEATRLGEIPDYDSMAAINIQTFLEETYPLKVSLDMLNEEMTLGELAEYVSRYALKRAQAM